MSNGKALKIRLVLTLACFLICAAAYAQPPQPRRIDSLNLDNIRIFPKSKIISKLVQQGIDAIRKDPDDTTNQTRIINAKSENAYKPFEGRIIRNINITSLDFEQKIGDTGNRIAAFGSKVMNAVHSDTKEWVIRNNLFIRQGEELSAYKVADNERFLRTLNFIQDARLVVHPVPGSPDSVDVEVITKDVFSISGGASVRSARSANANLSDANFLGMGQRVEVMFLYDQDRWPKVGHGLQYSKWNIGGSFINGTIGYMTFNPSAFDGYKEEHAYYVDLNRPLVSPYSYFAGGLFFGQKLTRNHYNRKETQFYKYNNIMFDGWAGVNIGCRKLLQNNNIRDRRFFSVRYMQNNFDEVPFQVGNSYNNTFNNMQLALGQLTLFRQDYFKTNYIYGFGVTEDIPFGYNLSLIGGWTKQLNLERPYAGIRAEKYTITNGGDFYHYFLRTGGYLSNRNMEDVSVLAGTNLFTRLLQYRNIKMRQYFSLSYARLFNRLTTDWLRINNPFGLRDFGYQFLGGYQRLSAQSETSVFLSRPLLGFKFSPFLSLNAALLTPDKELLYKSDIYTGIGGGVRTRNENLVFGTIEVRGMYFPRQVANQPAFKFSFTTNLRYRYNANYINRPDFVNVNSD